MNSFQTTARVGGDGEIHLTGVPFTAGTEVTIIVNPEISSTEKSDRVQALLAGLDRGRNTMPVRPLHREDLHERDSLG